MDPVEIKALAKSQAFLMKMLGHQNEVYIKGLDKVELLKHLWDNGGILCELRKLNPTTKFDYEKAKVAVQDYIDYFDNVCVKANFSEEVVMANAYDENAGAGTFKAIVMIMNKMKEKENE